MNVAIEYKGVDLVVIGEYVSADYSVGIMHDHIEIESVMAGEVDIRPILHGYQIDEIHYEAMNAIKVSEEI